MPQGSHNMTLHPSGDYLYNSNSDLYGADTTPNVTIYDVRKPMAPKKVQEYEIPFTPGSLGSESHDITFNKSGTRAYVAALSQTLILDTTDPRKPRAHQQDRRPGDQRRPPVRPVPRERARTAPGASCSSSPTSAPARRRARSAPAAACTSTTSPAPRSRARRRSAPGSSPPTQPQDGATCTSHVLRIYPRQKMMTIAWYSQGVRVLDISGLATYEGSPDRHRRSVTASA